MLSRGVYSLHRIRCAVSGRFAVCRKSVRGLASVVAARIFSPAKRLIGVSAFFVRMRGISGAERGTSAGAAHRGYGGCGGRNSLLKGVWRRVTPPQAVAACSVLLILAAVGAVLFSEARGKGAVRMRVSIDPVLPPAEKYGKERGRPAPAAGGNVVRGRTKAAVSDWPESEALPRAYGVIALSENGVSFATVDGNIFVQRLKAAAAFSLLAGPESLDGDPFVSATRGASPFFVYREFPGTRGHPPHWSGPDGAAPASLWGYSLRPPQAESSQRILYRAGGVKGLGRRSLFSAGGTAGTLKYRELVEQYARKYKLTTGLVLAIMRVESNFNPAAVSPNNAFGLMQVVRDTAGSEAHTFLTGRAGTPSMETLFNPEANIRYGTAYLHLLGRRYFRDVADAASREMCVIAAYNGGPNRVLRVFDKDRELAVAAINALTPEELYETLVNELPTAESRRYMELVMGLLREYPFGQ